ncbi:MAG TPA: formyltetrahydrofolate deformylase [Kofleriaceae bacterium]|jgi:formyltetrahydrofolate deformylase|nr:formyltetrahydrofolate deformylase [Kofleriaceae bacterium]
MTVGTLLVSCPDRKGIVASLAQVLYGHGANILDADQHTDPIAQMFFQRIRFDLSTMTTDRVALEHGIGEVASRFAMTYRISYASNVHKLAIFVSRYDHCLYDLLLRHRAGELACEVTMIVSNHPDLAPVAAQFGVPFHHLPVSADTRAAQEAAAQSLLEGARVDTIVLARYMQILSSDFVARWPARIINIHHSFLPAFVGGNPYRQAYERGVKLVGATAHYVTADLDQGPIIEQQVARASHRDAVDDLVRKGRDLEKLVLATAVRAHLDDRVLAYAGKTVVFD